MKWLLDEMLPPAAADRLRELGHDALSVRQTNLCGAPDDEVFGQAVAEGRLAVTENFSDYALILERRLSRGEACVPLVFVRKADFPKRGALAAHLAARLHHWSIQHPEPYLGAHWP